MAGRGREEGVVTTEEVGDVCKGVVGVLATWAQAGAIRSTRKDTTQKMVTLSSH